MKTIIEMAKEAGLRSAVLLHVYGKESALCDSELEELEQIKWFAALVRAEAQAEEREACAKACEKVAVDSYTRIGGEHEPYMRATAEDCARHIRARGQA